MCVVLKQRLVMQSKYKFSMWLYYQLYGCFVWIKSVMESAENIIGDELGDLSKGTYPPEKFKFTKKTKTYGYENNAFHEESDERAGSNNTDVIIEVNHSSVSGAKSGINNSHETPEQNSLKEDPPNRPFIVSATASRNNDSVGGKILTLSEIRLKLLSELKKIRYDIDEHDIDPLPLRLLMLLGEAKKELLSKLIASKLQSVTAEQVQELNKYFIDSLRNNEQYNFAGAGSRIVNFSSGIDNRNFEMFENTLFQVCGLILKSFVIIIEQYTIKGSTESVKKGYVYTLHLSVVTSNMFEEAMRQSQIQTVELTYTNVFPSDCRMFIGVPIYKGGYINTKDQL